MNQAAHSLPRYQVWAGYATGQNNNLAIFLARNEELHMFDARVSRLLGHATMPANYAACDLYVLTRIPTRNRFSMHENLPMSRFTQ